MDRRITLGVIVVLLALGGYIWYSFLRADAPPQTPVTPAPTPIAFMTISPDAVQAVEVRDVKNNKTTRLVRAGDVWNMEQPAQGGTDGDRVNTFLFGVSEIIATRKLDVTGDLAQFGLNPALYEIKLTLADGTTKTLTIGGKNPDSSAVYAQKNDDAAVYLIGTSTGDTITALVTTPPYTPTPTNTPAPTGAPEAPAATPTP